MNEIEVIVDIRTSPNKPEFVVVKRKLSAEGGELRLVGEPVETHLGVPVREDPLRRPLLDRGLLTIHRRAASVMDSLSEAERLQIIEQATRLANTPLAQWPQDTVILLEEETRLHLLSVPPDLRVFLKPLDDGRIEIIDVVREDALQQFMATGTGREAKP